MKTWILVWVGILFLSYSSSSQAASYHVDHRISLQGGQGWDWLTMDEIANRLFITRGTQVDILDLSTEKIVGTIPNLSGVHGVAIASDSHRGFVTNGLSGTVTIFDLSTFGVVKEIPVGKKPDGILYDSSTKRIFVFNGGSQDATVIDGETYAILQTIPLNGKPESSVLDEKGQVFVNIEDKSLLAVLDAKQMKLHQTWPLSPCVSPSGLAIDRANHRLFSVCENEKMVVLNSDTGKIVATLPIGKKPDAAAFDPSTHLAFSSNGEGTLTVVEEQSPSQFRVLSNVTTQKGARTLAVNTKNHNIYLITAKFEAPPPTAQSHPHPKIVSGTVELIVLKK